MKFKIPKTAVKTIYSFKGLPLKGRRTRLLAVGIVAIFLAGLVFSSLRLTKETEAVWYDDSYGYRHRVTFTHNAAVTTDSAVTFTLDTAELITANLMQSDCDDTRFTDANGKSLLFDLTGTCNNAATTYEVIFPSIVNGSNLFYVYYGNTSATNAEIDSTTYTALTPSGGDPSLTNPTSSGNQEKSPGPVLYYSFDQGTDNTCSGGANDACNSGISGTSLDGAQTGMTTPSATSGWQTEDQCISGKCLRFDSTDDVVAAASSETATDDMGAMIISAWIKPDTTGEGSAGRIIDKASSTVPANGWFLRTTGTNTLNFSVDYSGTNNLNVTTSNNAITLNRWSHVVVTWDGSATATNVHIYVNGKETTYQTQTNGDTSRVTDASSALRVGNDSTGATTFDGTIDEVKVYNYVRSAAQIKADFSSRGVSKGTSAQFGPENKWLSDSLVGYWKMDENTGTTTSDSSGNGNTSSAFTNQATWATGKFGTGITFDGTDDVVRIVESTSTDLGATTDSYTVSGWFKTSTDFSATAAIFEKACGGTTHPFRLVLNNTEQATFAIREGGNTVTSVGTASLNNNVWHFITGVRDVPTDTIYLYVDGVLVDSDSDTTTATTANNCDISIGNGDGGTYDSSDFNGNIDETRIYNRAFTPREIEGLYNWAPGPVGYWKLDENTGLTAYDTSGNGNSGTLSQSNWTSGKFGSALSAKANNTIEKATITDPSSGVLDFDYTQEFTISGWVKSTAAIENNGAFYIARKMFDLSGTQPGYYLYLGSGAGAAGINCAFVDNASHGDVASVLDSAGFDGNWHFYTCVMDRDGSAFGTAGLYLLFDGTVIASDQTLSGTTGGSNNVNLFFGENATNNEATNGGVDDVKIYNYARTAKQVVEDMNAGHPAPGSPIGSAVGHWKFDDMSCTTAQDQSQNNNDLTLNTASWTTSGKFGGAWNGTGALWVSRADDDDFDFLATESFAVSTWFKSDAAANPSATEWILNKSLSGGTQQAGYAIYANDTTGTICFAIDDDTTWDPDVSSCSSADFYDNSWHHIAGVRDVTSDKIYLYVDGIERDSDTDTTTATLANGRILYVGDRQGADGGDELNGDIDETKIFRLAMTPDQIKIDMNMGLSQALGDVDDHDSEGFGGNPPVGWWKLDENTGQSAYDSSGNGNAIILGSSGSVEASDPTWAKGITGTALDFDDSNADDEANAADSTSLRSPSTALTMAFWFRRDGNTGNYTWLAGKNYDTPSGHASYALRQQGTLHGQLEAMIRVSGSLSVTTLSNATSLNTWYFGVVRWTSGENLTLDIYNANGSLFHSVQTAGTVSGTIDYAAQPFWLGRNESGGNWWSGPIDDVKIYDYKRTNAQIHYDLNRGAPIAHYRFDECQGTTAYNSARNANGQAAGMNGTITPGAGTYTSAGTCGSGSESEMWNAGTTGKYNSSLDFDGSDDVVDLDNPTALQLTGAMTISAWVNFDALTQNSRIITKSGSGGQRGWELNIEDSDDTPRFNISTNGTTTIEAVSTKPLTTGNWVHLAGVYEPSTAIRLYRNGVLDNSYTTSVPATQFNSSNDVLIGSRSACGNCFMNGKIDDVRIYNYALTPLQVQKLFNENFSVRFGPSTGSP